MKISIYSFTEKGSKLENRIEEILHNKEFRGEKIEINKSRKKENVEEDFKKSDSLIFIGAIGIAIRLTSPFLESKLKDPCVICIDENAKYVIPVASGHVGGGNHLSKIIAEELMAMPVITTASDCEGVFSVDEFAAENNLQINDKSKIKEITKKLLNNEQISINFSDDVIVSDNINDSENCLLHLLMRPYIVGMGCRKNKDFESVEKFFLETLHENNIDPKLVLALATIDLKSEEPALLMLCEKYNLRFVTYSAEELKKAEGEFDNSSFVETVTGVSDVSERAAKLLGKTGKFIVKKEKKDGMTISVFEKLRRINLKYE